MYRIISKQAEIEVLRGRKVSLRRKSDGKIIRGTLDMQNDWLVGCPIVMPDDGGGALDVGYYHDIVVMIDQPPA